MSQDRALPNDVDAFIATDARVHAMAFGGKDNFAADRAFAAELMAATPRPAAHAMENRKFMRRAVRFMAAQGIRQFLDLGCGMPGRGNPHQIAQAAAPGARVVYVDYDPMAVRHYQAELWDADTTAAIHADIRDPAGILARAEVTRLIDFDQPVGVLMLYVLYSIPDKDDPAGVVGAFRDTLAPGSFLAQSHLTHENRPAHEVEAVTKVLEQLREPVLLRGRAEVAALFDGLALVEPGLVLGPEWRPDRPYGTPSGWMLAGVGQKP
jgi:SAM-dependent methyltransferase